MIETLDAIRVGRSLLDTPYSTLDCINFIKKIIRTAPGGDIKYTTAGTNTLWRSNDLLSKFETAKDALPGMLVFKHRNQPTEKYNDADGDVHHIGLVTECGTVLHSSSVKGQVVESALDNSWHYSAVHRLIKIKVEGKKNMSDWLVVTTKDGGNVNIRSGPGTEYPVIGKARTGELVTAVSQCNGWNYIRYDGKFGYMCSDYLKAYESGTVPESAQEQMTEEAPVDGWTENPTLISEAGPMITLSGKWRMCVD